MEKEVKVFLFSCLILPLLLRLVQLSVPKLFTGIRWGRSSELCAKCCEVAPEFYVYSSARPRSLGLSETPLTWDLPLTLLYELLYPFASVLPASSARRYFFKYLLLRSAHPDVFLHSLDVLPWWSPPFLSSHDSLLGWQPCSGAHPTINSERQLIPNHHVPLANPGVLANWSGRR